MTEYDNTNRGSIWRNEKKQTEQHPDFTGKCDINGVEFWIAGWKRKAGDNPKSPALRLAFTPKDEPKPTPVTPQQPAAADFDDDIPF